MMYANSIFVVKLPYKCETLDKLETNLSLLHMIFLKKEIFYIYYTKTSLCDSSNFEIIALLPVTAFYCPQLMHLGFYTIKREK